MKDRIPTKPGRVLITPEGGGAPYYATVTMADEPTEQGTPPTKANLLKDATAALYGLGSGALVDEVLSIIFNTKAPKSSPELTGVPTAPTAADGTKTTQIATTAFAAKAGAGVVTGSFTIGASETKTVNLGLRPFLVLVYHQGNNDSAVPVTSTTVTRNEIIKIYSDAFTAGTYGGITSTGFTIKSGTSAYTGNFYYIALYK